MQITEEKKYQKREYARHSFGIKNINKLEAVCIAGMIYNIEHVDCLSGRDGDSRGDVDGGCRNIRIANSIMCYENKTPKHYVVSDDEKMQTLWHEIWHAMCFELEENELNTEQNAAIFSILMIQHSEIDRKFILMADQQDNKIQFVVEKIKFYCEEDRKE